MAFSGSRDHPELQEAHVGLSLLNYFCPPPPHLPTPPTNADGVQVVKRLPTSGALTNTVNVLCNRTVETSLIWISGNLRRGFICASILRSWILAILSHQPATVSHLSATDVPHPVMYDFTVDRDSWHTGETIRLLNIEFKINPLFTSLSAVIIKNSLFCRWLCPHCGHRWFTISQTNATSTTRISLLKKTENIFLFLRIYNHGENKGRGRLVLALKR